jgi:sulfonate transport system ATP-binding protein
LEFETLKHYMAHAGILSIQALHKHYQVNDMTLPVLQDINLALEPGEFISIVGPSGCGKSTLLRLIIGLDQDYQGDIFLDGQRITGTSLQRGIVFQEPRLFPWLNVEKNIALGLLNSDLNAAQQHQTIREHITLVGLCGFETAYPHQLSGGMAQRVAIARALVNRPAILLLDEPFGALDIVTRAQMQQALYRIWEQERITMILVTHNVEEAVYLGNRVVILEPRPGRIRRIVPVQLAHPRDRLSNTFKAVESSVHQEINLFE